LSFFKDKDSTYPWVPRLRDKEPDTAWGVLGEERAWGVLDSDWAKKPRLKDVGRSKKVISPVLVDSVIPVPDLLQAPDIWSTCTLAGICLPGFCTLKFSRERKIDVKAGGGTDGASTTDKGYSPAKVTITWKFYYLFPSGPTPGDQFAAFVSAMKVLEPLAAKKERPPISIEHPVATIRQCHRVQITKIDGPEIDDQKVHTVTIDCIEWKPPAPTKGAGGAISKDVSDAFIRLGLDVGKVALDSAKMRSKKSVGALLDSVTLFDPPSKEEARAKRTAERAEDELRAKRVADRASPDSSEAALARKAAGEDWDSLLSKPPRLR